MSTTGHALRDSGHACTTAAADPRLVLTVDKVIAVACATGKRFCSDDIRDALPVVAGPLVGARIRAAALRRSREMKRGGAKPSALLSARRAYIAVWQGTQTPRVGPLPSD